MSLLKEPMLQTPLRANLLRGYAREVSMRMRNLSAVVDNCRSQTLQLLRRLHAWLVARPHHHGGKNFRIDDVHLPHVAPARPMVQALVV